MQEEINMLQDSVARLLNFNNLMEEAQRRRNLTRFRAYREVETTLRNTVMPELFAEFSPFEQSERASRIINAQIIRNIGIEEYLSVYIENTTNTDTMAGTGGFSYMENTQNNAYRDVLVRISNNMIDLMRDGEIRFNEALEIALESEISLVEDMENSGNFPIKDPKERIDDIKREAGVNTEKHIAPASGYFKALEFQQALLQRQIDDGRQVELEANDLSPNLIDEIRDAANRRRGNSRRAPLTHVERLRQEEQSSLTRNQQEGLARVVRTYGENLSMLWINVLRPFLINDDTPETEAISTFFMNMDRHVSNGVAIPGAELIKHQKIINSAISNMDEEDVKTLFEIIKVREVREGFNRVSSRIGINAGDMLRESLVNAISARHNDFA